MMRVMLCVLVLVSLAWAVTAAAQTAAEIQSLSLVWVQPLDGSAGQGAVPIALRWPKVGSVNLDTLPVLNFIKIQVLAETRDGFPTLLGDLRLNPGLGTTLETELGVKVKAGLTYLPLTKYKLGWYVGMNVYQRPL